MNLYELAHHPLAWTNKKVPVFYVFAAFDSRISTDAQWELLKDKLGDPKHYFKNHTDENEFRMHLLFVHWATLGDQK